MDENNPSISLDAFAQKAELIRSEVVTQSLDLDWIFNKGVTSSGSFDLRGIQNSALGKILGSIPIPILLINSERVIVFANDAFTKIGAANSDLVGLPFSRLLANVPETHRALAALDQIFSDRKNRVFETLIGFNGRTSYCRVNFRSVRHGNHRSVLCLIEDLTAAKRQLLITEKYHQLVQVFPIGLAEFALIKPVSREQGSAALLERIGAAKLVGGNQQFAKMIGRGSVEEIKSQTLRELLPFDDADREIYVNWAETGFPMKPVETSEQAGGSVVFFENTLVANLKQKHLLGFWVMRHDITERKQIEETLRSSRDQLEEKVKARTAELTRMNEKLVQEIGERQKAEDKLAGLVMELQDALTKVKTLSGLLPICAACKKIRDDKGYWTQVEVYVSEHSEADFTHSICPDCAQRLYPDYYKPGSYE
jgi:PAS domain S-box-containing protein